MKTRYEIEVSQTDCAEGVRGNAHYCVVHTAIGRLIPDALRITVDAQTIRFSLMEDGVRKRFVYLTPHQVRDYVIAFDAGDDIQPFSFVLDKPQVTEVPVKAPGTAKNVSFKAAAAGTEARRSLRVFGERSFRVNQVAQPLTS